MCNTSHNDNWNNEWYQQLHKQAMFVVQNTRTKNIDLDELINVAWLQCVRFIDKDVETIAYTKRVRCFMYDYIRTKAGRIGYSLSDDYDIQYKHAPFVNIEDIELVEQHLSKLNNYERRLIEMRYLLGLDFHEIGILLCESKQTIHNRVHAAMRKVRKHLNESPNPACV